MSVRAVSAQVTAHRQGLQFYRDADAFDAMTDALATGEDIYTSDEEIPAGRGLRRYKHLFPSVGASHSPRAGEPA